MQQLFEENKPPEEELPEHNNIVEDDDIDSIIQQNKSKLDQSETGSNLGGF